VIWPENHETDEKRCFIHDLEKKRLGIGGLLASRADVYPNPENPHTLVVSYFIVNSANRQRFKNTPMSIIDMNITVQHQMSQKWDKGGCYLDPQEMDTA
jgi:hypothetical protein